jgi:hypothetical protein
MTNKKYFDINSINYNNITKKGSCKLVSQEDNSNLILVWSIQNYPEELPIMPGSLYNVQVDFTIINDCKKRNSMSGTFIYEISNGVLVKYSDLGIPFGCYKCMAFNNKYGDLSEISFYLNENYLEICIK